MTANITSDTWIRIVAELSECLKAPSEAIPNVRWMSGTRLRKLLVDIRNKANAPKHESGTKLLSLLIDSKLVWPLPPDDFSDCGKPCAIYALKFSGAPSISPIELLQATQPSYHHTVICYFTALAHHELTTQDAPHHHVAVLRTPPKPLRPESATPPPGQRRERRRRTEARLAVIPLPDNPLLHDAARSRAFARHPDRPPLAVVYDPHDHP